MQHRRNAEWHSTKQERGGFKARESRPGDAGPPRSTRLRARIGFLRNGNGSCTKSRQNYDALPHNALPVGRRLRYVR